MPISISIPDGLELVVSVPKLVRRVGHRAAGEVRKRLREGMGASGAMPSGGNDEKDRRALYETGELNRSIKFQPRGKFGGVIFATGTRANGKRNGEVLAIQMKRRDNGALRASDPMGVDARVAAAAEDEGAKEIRKQTNTGETKLKARGRKRK